jgi:alkylhydroperoxidase family enzyme
MSSSAPLVQSDSKNAVVLGLAELVLDQIQFSRALPPVSVAIVSRRQDCGVERRSPRRQSATAADRSQVILAAWGEAKDDRGNDEGENCMSLRVPMVSLERSRELGEAMGLPARRTQSEAFRVLANNPGVARVAYNQLIQLLENNKFDTRLRELMIMRIGWVTGSAYEWTQHWRVATTAGIPQEDILAVRDWRNSERLTPADRAILAATDECLDGKSISDAAWAEVVKHVTDPEQQVEFIIAMGNWMMFSLLFRNLRIPLAEGVTVWPPDGLASPAAQR